MPGGVADRRLVGFPAGVEAVAAGCTNAQAAERLFVSPSTIKTHLAHIFRKLDVSDRKAAVQAARDRRLL